MKLRTTLPLLATLTFIVGVQPLLAAPKKADPRLTQLVAALKTVSPDPLGGRLGLDLATARAPQSPLAAQNGRPVQTADASADQRAYQSWKTARKS